MSKTVEVTVTNPIAVIIGILTAIIGYHIHHSIFWSIVDWIFWPFAWLKWFICSEVSVTIIKGAFASFLQ